MVSEIRHTGLVVRSLYNGIKFYQSIGFGLWAKGEVTEEQANGLYGRDLPLKYAKLRPMNQGHGTPLLELYQFKDPLFTEHYFKNIQFNFYHVSLTVKDIMETWKFFNRRNLLVSKKILEIDKHKLFFARDPWGNLLELVEPL